jgi:hypothetical protein
MKKTLIITAIIIGLTSTAFAADKIIKNRYTLPAGSSYYINADVIDREAVDLFKVRDGDTTCYITSLKINGVRANTAISCVK